MLTVYIIDCPILSSDNLIPQALHDAFVKEINDVSKNSKYDFHPGTEGKVMNLIHPSMFPYKVMKRQKERKASISFYQYQENRISDYQWLPTNVLVDADGNCKFMSYINNLYLPVYPNLYPILECILSCFIPLFEACLHQQLKQRKIQVIVKAVNYILQPGQSYEGNWHLEGTPQENIIATGIYYYEETNQMMVF
ncbi:hypothetical protein HMI56_002685 [Coelomomyces lativittatus]|nr:hypothetical protein HMI56_002685 [Coelomomyces lativittatus]